MVVTEKSNITQLVLMLILMLATLQNMHAMENNPKSSKLALVLKEARRIYTVYGEDSEDFKWALVGIQNCINEGYDVNTIHSNAAPLLRHAEYPDIACLLIKNGADVTVRNFNNSTGLHAFFTVIRNDTFTDKKKELLFSYFNAGADINAQDEQKRTPLMLLLSTSRYTKKDYMQKRLLTIMKNCLALQALIKSKNSYFRLLEPELRHHVIQLIGAKNRWVNTR